METRKVRDLMVPLGEYPCIPKDATLYDAAVRLQGALRKHPDGADPYRAILVCDKAGRIIGKLSLLDLLMTLTRNGGNDGRSGYSPKAAGDGLGAELLRSVIDAYDVWKMDLDELCQKAAKVSVGVITKSPHDGEFIDADASLNKAIHQLVSGRHQSLLVTGEGQMVGILRLSDLCTQVADRIQACES